MRWGYDVCVCMCVGMWKVGMSDMACVCVCVCVSGAFLEWSTSRLRCYVHSNDMRTRECVCFGICMHGRVYARACHSIHVYVCV